MATVLNHPLITHKLSIMRNKNTGRKGFRLLCRVENDGCQRLRTWS